MQTSFQDNFDQLTRGMITPYAVKELVTGIATEDIGFAIAVKRGAVEGQVTPIAQGDTVYGVSVKYDNGLGTYQDGDAVTVMTKGALAVKVADAVTVAAGEPAYFVAASGEFTNVVGDNDLVGVFQSSKKNDNLAIVKLDIVA